MVGHVEHLEMLLCSSRPYRVITGVTVDFLTALAILLKSLINKVFLPTELALTGCFVVCPNLCKLETFGYSNKLDPSLSVTSKQKSIFLIV